MAEHNDAILCPLFFVQSKRSTQLGPGTEDMKEIRRDSPPVNLLCFVATRQVVGSAPPSRHADKGAARLCVKDAVLMVKETRVVQIDRAEYLLGMTLAGRGNQRLAALAGPGLVQCRILAKTGFVLENQCGFFSGRFFLRLGYVYRCHRCCCALSAWARRRFGRCTEKPSSWRSFRTWPGW